MGIGKWLMSVLTPSGWKVELKSCLCYRRGVVNIDMVVGEVPQPELISLVFFLDRAPTALNDPTQLAGAPVHAVAVAQANVEETCAVQIARKAVRLHDLDIQMQKDAEFRTKLIEECAKMLALRNYDPDHYRAWASNIPEIPAA